ncbi:MAG: 3'(2'),5'-bisphosphate nucleotidase [Deltaproteobacteria bacterium]|nr:3'(2'),5'-bisphosphate nucleotidase [Deltaproteobacteria bacterium]MBN2674751.1 3'(2'),5'-bisphosphate nucleotidase [Deltaproteobacteria bacterium]
MTTPYQKEKEIAVAAIAQAAVICKNVQTQIDLGVLEKNDKSPVTVADFGSQALVCKMLNETFAADPVIGEEDSKSLRQPENEGLLTRLMNEVQQVLPEASPEQVLGWIDKGGQDSYTERFWTLDPIDGTKGFLRKDQYAISLALIVNGEIVVGALCCPNMNAQDGTEGVIFAAEKGQGAVEIPLGKNTATPISVSRENVQANIRTCESVEKAHSSHSDSARIAQLLGITADPVRIDSQAKYATVARGDAEAYLRLPRDGKYREKIWDHAGGVLVVEEAGGKVTDIKGRPLEFTHGRTLQNNLGVIVTSGTFHDAVIKAIDELNIGKF